MKKYLLSCLFLLIIPFVSNSQTRVEEQISIDLNPRFPGVNEFVSVSINSFQINLDKSDINWYINGQLVNGGFGQKNFNFTTGDLGDETKLKISITKEDGKVVEKNYTINPGEIDLYYEAETYSPPFYKGRSEYSNQSRLKIIAIPNFSNSSGNIIDKENIVYKWKIDGDVDQNSSGLGKNIYEYQSGFLSGPIQVTVEATPLNSNQFASVTETIRPIEPSILVYEKNPIYGTIFSQNINDRFTLNREEIELEAVPYDFSKNIFSVGNFKWLLNGSRIYDFDLNNITFRREDNNPSSNNVTIEIDNTSKILQLQTYSFDLNFGDGSLDFNF